MEKMTLLDFMVYFFEAQPKEYLINEILKLNTEVHTRNSPHFMEHWIKLGENCGIEIVS